MRHDLFLVLESKTTETSVHESQNERRARHKDKKVHKHIFCSLNPCTQIPFPHHEQSKEIVQAYSKHSFFNMMDQLLVCCNDAQFKKNKKN